MNVNEVFPSRYLKAHELQGKEPVVTIARVEFETIGRTREQKPIVFFRGKEKGLKINKTMALAISKIAGSAETEAWTGVAIQLFATVTDFGGETFEVIRIKAPYGTAPRVERPVAAPAPAVYKGHEPIVVRERVPVEITSDDIPF